MIFKIYFWVRNLNAEVKKTEDNLLVVLGCRTMYSFVLFSCFELKNIQLFNSAKQFDSLIWKRKTQKKEFLV